MNADILVIGIGQSLRSDDGAGQAAVRYWQSAFPLSAGHARVRIELVELPGLGLLDLLKDAPTAILVDAVCSGASPGTIHLLAESDLASFGAGAGSAHGWGVAETLLLGRQLDPDSLPTDLTIVGIEAGSFALGSKLTSSVQFAIPAAAEMIEGEVRCLLETSRD